MGRYEEVAEASSPTRLTATEIAVAVKDYGRRLILPPDVPPPHTERTEIHDGSGRVYLAMPLWTEEEGRSDLSLELIIRQDTDGKWRYEILGIHVL